MNMKMEQEYKEIDFSRFSKVRESLKAKLWEEMKQSTRSVNVKRELDFEEMDYLAAAGNPNAMGAHSSESDDMKANK